MRRPAAIIPPGRSILALAAALRPKVRFAPPQHQERPDSPVEFSARAGFVTDYIYRGTTLSARQPAVGAAFEAAMNIFYAGLTVASVKLPTQPAAEITTTAGVRPKLGNINFDLSATRYFYPGETVAPGEFAGIEYWEAIARADTSLGELFRMAAGFA